MPNYERVPYAVSGLPENGRQNRDEACRRCNARRAPCPKQLGGRHPAVVRFIITTCSTCLQLKLQERDWWDGRSPAHRRGAMLALDDAGAGDADSMQLELLRLLPSASAQEKAPLEDATVSLWKAHRAQPPAAEAVMRAELKHTDVGFFYFQSCGQIVAVAAYYLHLDYLESGCLVVWLSARGPPSPDLAPTKPKPSPKPCT